MAIVTNAGLALTVSRLMGSGDEPDYIAWGTGDTAEAASQSALDNEAAEDRVQGSSSAVTTDVSNDTYQVVGEMVSESTQAITEVGLFTASTSGTMFMRAVFDEINVDEDDSIEFTIQVQYAQPE